MFALACSHRQRKTLCILFKNTKARPDHKQLRLAPVSVSNDMPLFLIICLSSGRVPHLESVRRGTQRRNGNLIIFKAKLEVIKGLWLITKWGPAVVVSVGKELQREPASFWGEPSLLHGIVIRRGVWRCLRSFHQSEVHARDEKSERGKRKKEARRLSEKWILCC